MDQIKLMHCTHKKRDEKKLWFVCHVREENNPVYIILFIPDIRMNNNQ